MRVQINGFYDAPTPRTRYERSIQYFVGFLKGSSLVVSRLYDNYEDAVDKMADLQMTYPERDYHLYEQTVQFLCMV